MLRFVERYGLPSEKCFVINNGVDPQYPGKQWAESKPWRYRCVYISDPGRGLETLIRAWRHIDCELAELHVWSGTRLWGRAVSDQRYYHLFAEASDSRGVFYHGIANNSTIRLALRDMHFFVMPSDFLETFCISAVEAMASGCRIVAPGIGALPEIVGDFGRLYERSCSGIDHTSSFLSVLNEEFAHPWGGSTDLRERQVAFVGARYSWSTICTQWYQLVNKVGVPGGSLAEFIRKR